MTASPTSAAASWRRSYEGRSIPAEVLAAAPVSPFGFSSTAFARRTEAVLSEEAGIATRRALDALPVGGQVLDVGVGAGAASLPLAPPAARIVGVDTSVDMLGEFLRLAAARGVDAESIVGTWPDVASSVAMADVAVCHSTLYVVPDLGPFAEALSSHARHRVVLAIPDRHWLSWQDDLWLHFHGVTREPANTAASAEAVLLELGIPVHREQETVALRYDSATRTDAVAEVRRRLCLRPEQDGELGEALGDRLRERDGRWLAAPRDDMTMVTLWWDT